MPELSQSCCLPSSFRTLLIGPLFRHDLGCQSTCCCRKHRSTSINPRSPHTHTHPHTHLIFRLSLGFFLPLQLLQQLVLLLLADTKLFLQRLKLHLRLHLQLRVLVLDLLRFCSQQPDLFIMESVDGAFSATLSRLLFFRQRIISVPVETMHFSLLKRTVMSSLTQSTKAM